MMKRMHKLATGIERLTPTGDADPPKNRISCLNMLYDVPSIITDNVLHRHGDPEPALRTKSGNNIPHLYNGQMHIYRGHLKRKKSCSS